MNEQSSEHRPGAHEAVEAERPRSLAGEVSVLARTKDPSLSRAKARPSPETEMRRPGVEWVRSGDLMARGGSRIAGRGIDLQAELARRSRYGLVRAGRSVGRGMRTTGHAAGERARRLPPASAFGRGSGERFSWVSRSGIGLG
ncbi:hypothetical protein J4H92_15010 [Leucobacter weissii]|uniref:Uncharacterized protein n=1 Tax=Leucobacter weissii TaxID=1983706 RepID=A0A939SBR6_9MICO|nr:hypothetical protein [Leucobacter weissii]MBO1903252.1 hypothetical protein [Leucobacter weissii]